MLRNTAFSSPGVSGGAPAPARQLDRFAEAGNCSDDRAPVDRPQLGRNHELLPVYSGTERSNPFRSSGESSELRFRLADAAAHGAAVLRCECVDQARVDATKEAAIRTVPMRSARLEISPWIAAASPSIASTA